MGGKTSTQKIYTIDKLNEEVNPNTLNNLFNVKYKDLIVNY